MMNIYHRDHLYSGKMAKKGSSLLISLVMITLLTAIVLAFLSRSETNYKVESSSAARMRAEIMARSSLHYTVALLTKEITRPENSISIDVPEVDGKVYRPKTEAKILPAVQIKSGLNAARMSHMPGIVKQSIAAMDPMASTINSGTANKQGRLVEPSRWNDPAFYYGATPQFSTTAQSPDWIYFSTNGAVNTASENIIGRTAFNIYNIDNLIDISVAGYPASLKGDVRKINALKSSLAGADMSKLGTFSLVLSDPNMFIVDLRNRRSVRDGSYFERVLTNSNGLTATAAGDTHFVSRMDLLRFCYANGMDNNPLAYLTAWTRTLDAPSVYITPVTEENAFAPAVLRTIKGTVTDYFLQTNGTITTRQRDLKVGDAVVSRRFALNRIAFFNAAPGALRTAAISRYFGLEVSTNGQWQYADTNIKTLNEIKDLSREPNFFEMLKAAILTGSLGTYDMDDTQTFNPLRDQNKDLQILRIGASIIDASGFTRHPTIISKPDISGSTAFVTGVKDLPYLYGVRFRQLIKTDAAGNIQQVDHFALPILVNPHSEPYNNGKTRPVTRIRISGDVENASSRISASNNISLTSKLLSDTPLEQRVMGYSANLYRTLSPVSEAVFASEADAPELHTAVMPDYYSGSYRAFWLATATVDSGTVTHAVDGTATLRNFNLILEYWNGSIWVPYDALTGDGWGGVPASLGDNVTVSFSTAQDAKVVRDNADFSGPNTEYYIKPDPRTNRWGVANGFTTSSPIQAPTEAATSYSMVQLTPSASFPTVADRDGTSRMNDLGASGEEITAVLERIDSRSRQAFLNRRYYVVAELGNVFRDQPWKTLDFYSTNSGDKALLDYFSINESDEHGNVAGRINLNLRSPQDAISPLMSHISSKIDGAETLLTSQINSMQGQVATKSNGQKPFQSPADLVGLTQSFTTGGQATANKQTKEALARTLGTSTQTRTWNFFIDLIAQTGGMYPQTSTDLGKDFIVQGESRLWMHVAIDRFTGKVIASHTEVYQE